MSAQAVLDPLNSVLVDLNDLSDFAFETHADQIAARANKAKNPVVDLRKVEWIDVWALMQLLLLLRGSARQVFVLAASPELYDDHDKRKRASSKLRFLFDIGFVQVATEAGFTFVLQEKGPKFRALTRDDVLPGLAEHAAGDLHGLERPLIPITSLKRLQTPDERRSLVERYGHILKRYGSEYVIEQGSLSDCLLAELVSNAVEHGGGDGYLSLHAVSGLRQVRYEDSDAYIKRRAQRDNHPLPDWRAFFSEHPEDAFLELIVVDVGPGIEATIGEDPRMPRHLKEMEPSLGRTDAWLRYSLRRESSRLSADARVELGRTKFTGLAAVAGALTTVRGCLLVRERASRHCFGSTEDLDTLDSRGTGVCSSRCPSFSVTIAIPITHASRPAIGIIAQMIPPPSGHATQIAVLRVAPPEGARRSLIDRRLGTDWTGIRQNWAEKTSNAGAVVIDVSGVATTKNELWPGLSETVKLARSTSLPVFLAGMTERLAHRLDDFAELDEGTEPGGSDWMVLGFGDDGVGYAAGRFGRNAAEHRSIAERAAGAFLTADDLTVGQVALLESSGYHPTPAGGLGQFSVSPSWMDLTLLVSTRYGELLASAVRETAAWAPNTIVRLADGDVIQGYLSIHGLENTSEVYESLLRLAVLRGSCVDFTYVVGVGSAARRAAEGIFRAMRRARNRRNRPPVLGLRTYQDYSSFDYGESEEPQIPSGVHVCVVADGVRTGGHSADVEEHIAASGSSVAGMVALVDLAGDNASRTSRREIAACFSQPISSVSADSKADAEESPFSLCLESTAVATSPWPAVLSRAQAYRALEDGGLLFEGHCVAFGHHFSRTIALSFLLSSATLLAFDILDYLVGLVRRRGVDCLIYPEHSSVGLLAARLVAETANDQPVTIVQCRRAMWPGRVRADDADLVGRSNIRAAKSVLVLEDASYTCGSIRDMFSLLRAHAPAGHRTALFAVVNSARRNDERLVVDMLELMKTANSSDASATCYMKLAMTTYWSPEECPLCARRAWLSRPEIKELGPVERRYVGSRLKALAPTSIEDDPHSRRLHPLDQEWQEREVDGEVVTAHTLEGLLLLCEEKYLKGQLGWILDRCEPNDPRAFSQSELVLSALELLGADLALLQRAFVWRRYVEVVRRQLAGGYLEGQSLIRLIEMCSTWPLHWLSVIWEELLSTVLEEWHLYSCYPAIELLLLEIDTRPQHSLRVQLRHRFDRLVLERVAAIRDDDGAEKARRVFGEVLQCLRAFVGRIEADPGIGHLVSHLCALTGYFSRVRRPHQPLWFGLNCLQQATDDTPVDDLLRVMVLLSQLEWALLSLERKDPAAHVWESGGRELSQFREELRTLEGVAPTGERLGSAASTIRECAQNLSSVLFSDDPAPQGAEVDARSATPSTVTASESSLGSTLRHYLAQYRSPVSDLLRPILQLGANDSRFSIDCNRADLWQRSTYVVMDRATLDLVFDELAANLSRLPEPGQGVLFGELRTISIGLDDGGMETLKIRIQSSCSRGDWERWKAGLAEGSGAVQVRAALARLGHTYEEPTFESVTGVLTQTITLARIYR